MIDWRIVVCGIICLTVLEVVALYNGINGTLFSLVVMIIGLAIGVTLPQVKTKGI